MFDRPIKSTVVKSEIMDYFTYRTQLAIPNVDRMEYGEFLNVMASCSGLGCEPGIHWSKLDPKDRLEWTRVCLNRLQDGGYDGSGYFIRYDPQGKPVVGRFAVCRHENKYLPSANPSRGHHDMFCVKCGLNTSYDSSD